MLNKKLMTNYESKLFILTLFFAGISSAAQSAPQRCATKEMLERCSRASTSTAYMACRNSLPQCGISFETAATTSQLKCRVKNLSIESDISWYPNQYEAIILGSNKYGKNWHVGGTTRLSNKTLRNYWAAQALAEARERSICRN